MTDQKADTAEGRDVAVDPGGTSAEKSFENEGGGNQAPVAAPPTSLVGKVEGAMRTLRARFIRPGKAG